MNSGLEGPLPVKCGSSAPRSHRHKAVLSHVALTSGCAVAIHMECGLAAASNPLHQHGHRSPTVVRRCERLAILLAGHHGDTGIVLIDVLDPAKKHFVLEDSKPGNNLDIRFRPVDNRN